MNPQELGTGHAGNGCPAGGSRADRTPRDLTIDAQHLEDLFRKLYFPRYRTLLVAGSDEPLYLPAAQPDGIHYVRFRADYVASALHEVAHWCLAGPDRRRRVDYGYWYLPAPRDGASQRHFETVETTPQALEWIFADAAGCPFRPSLDNLDRAASQSAIAEFEGRIAGRKEQLLRRGLPGRAARFQAALARRG